MAGELRSKFGYDNAKAKAREEAKKEDDCKVVKIDFDQEIA